MEKIIQAVDVDDTEAINSNLTTLIKKAAEKMVKKVTDKESQYLKPTLLPYDEYKKYAN